MIFETERLLVRKLILEDLQSFHKLESSSNVLLYAEGKVKTFDKNKNELNKLILKYENPKNNFCIYAIERTSDSEFVGTLALIKDGKDDEIGYRFLEKYWNLGYGSEICEGLITYCKQLGLPKIIGYVIDKNIASVKILKKHNFNEIATNTNTDLQLPETKYELYL